MDNPYNFFKYGDTCKQVMQSEFRGYNKLNEKVLEYWIPKEKQTLSSHCEIIPLASHLLSNDFVVNNGKEGFNIFYEKSLSKLL